MKRKYTTIISLVFCAMFAANSQAATSKLVPARDTLESLGFVTEWDAESKTAVFKNDNYTVTLTADNDYFEVNGKKITFENALYENDMYSTPIIIDGRFYLPDAELAKAIGEETLTPDTKALPENGSAVDFNTQKLSDIEAITNARQLGGYVNTEGRKIKQNVILRTGKPSDGTEEDLKVLSEKYHVSDIVDFRSVTEAETAPEPTVEGAVYHHIPLNIAGDMSNMVTDEFKQAYVKAMQSGDKGELLLTLAKNNVLPTPKMYEYFLGDEAAEGYREFFNILLNKKEDASVLFHCTQGKDRTGMGAALFLYALDFDDDTIMEDYLLTNTANVAIIQNDVDSVSKYTDDIETIEKAKMMDGVSAELLQSVIDKMNEEYGSVKGYLQTRLNLSDEEIAKLKEIYLEPAEG